MLALQQAPRLGFALLVALGAAGLAGCQTDLDVTPTLNPTSPAFTEQPSSAPTVVPSTLARSVKPAPLISPKCAASLASAPWRLIAISSDERTLTVWANQGSACDKPAGIEVTESRTNVELVSVYAQGRPPSGDGCLASLDAPLWSVRLQRPLGQRTLAHAPAIGSVP